MQARVPAARLRPVTRAALALLAGAGLAIPVPAQNAPGAGADRNLVIALPAPPAPVVAPSAARRVALVIGNASYKDAPLTNPVNDARAIAQALRDSGFAVTLRENADMKEMLAAVRGFGDELRKGGVGVFYFAGHGMQIKGRNYLIPVGGSIEREDEVAYSAVDAQAVLDKMDAAGNGTNLLILDACRNNPFARSFRSAQQGLAQMDAPVGTLVAFATSPGSVASDGQGGNGLYTQHLLQAMREPGAKVEDVFKRVRANVRRDSQGKQVPWESTSLEGDFYFLTPKPAAAPESGDAALEKAMWALVKESRQALEIKAFLSRFPSGAFAKEAGARLAALEEGARRTAADAQAAAAKAPAAPAPAPAPAAAAAPPAPAAASAVRPPVQVAAPAAAPVAAPTAVPPAAPALASLPAAAAKPGPASNAFGFRVGDRWNYQTVDKYKAEVIENWSRRIGSIAPDGSLLTTTGTLLSPEGNERKTSNRVFQSRTFDSANIMIPRNLSVGHRENFKFTERSTRLDGTEIEQSWSGTLEVVRTERVRVPAGEFEALRIERKASVDGREPGSVRTWSGTLEQVLWYVPQVRSYVANDFTFRPRLGAADRFRVELTSYEVAPGPVALAR